MGFGVNQRPRSLVRDLCETQTAEYGVSRKRVIGVGFLLELIARGENRLFSPEEVRPICFCGSNLCSCPLFPLRFFLPPTAGERVILSLLDSFPHKSFAAGERRPTKQKQIASGRRRCAGASGLFIRFRELQKIPRHFLYLIRSDSRLARRESRPLQNRSGLSELFSLKG